MSRRNLRSSRTIMRCPDDLSVMSSSMLRRLCDRAYRQLESNNPRPGARDTYKALVEELDMRKATPESNPDSARSRTSVRDHFAVSRFEIWKDGTEAGYVQYEMRGAEIRLLRTKIDPRFSTQGFESLLMGTTLRSAHRRRLAVIPFCPVARKFFSTHPEYIELIPSAERARFKLAGSAAAM